MNGFYIEQDEAIQIFIAVIALSFAFSIANFGGFEGLFIILSRPGIFIMLMGMSFVTVGSGFILHEMAHKIAAINYGSYARFHMWTQGLLLMLVTSLFGFIFAAPGAVYIYSRNITRVQNGVISLVGPLVNIAIAAFFVFLGFASPVIFLGTNVWFFGAVINATLATFNLIPIHPLDGSKVMAWHWAIWLASIGISGLSLFYSYSLFR